MQIFDDTENLLLVETMNHTIQILNSNGNELTGEIPVCSIDISREQNSTLFGQVQIPMPSLGTLKVSICTENQNQIQPIVQLNHLMANQLRESHHIKIRGDFQMDFDDAIVSSLNWGSEIGTGINIIEISWMFKDFSSIGNIQKFKRYIEPTLDWRRCGF